MGEMIDFPSEGGTVSGYLALPSGGNGPGVLLMHAWWGLNSFFTDLADRLAGEGYVVLAPDLYGGRTASTIEEAEELSSTLDYREAIKHEVGAADYLLGQDRVTHGKLATIGFSMGATYATWLAMLRPEIAAVVLFYGGSDWQPEGFPEQTQAAFLGHFAENDPYESLEGVEQLRQTLTTAGREAAMHVYPGTGHWFFEGDRPDAYNEAAARAAWERTVEFLRGRLQSR